MGGGKKLAYYRIKCNTSTFIGVVMTKHFEQLSAEERATIMVMAQEGQSLRAMARALHRA
ncbi:MAG: helix-turn-helix domain-containing protein, partial [Clostridia bacterium]|nr:helix-turn-helix domain-containing protein [Clostridia bacterium]